MAKKSLPPGKLWTERDNAITVGELITRLSKMDPSLPVGFIGHFGEFYGLSDYGVTIREAWGDAATYGWGRLESENQDRFECAAIDQRDIGPDPL